MTAVGKGPDWAEGLTFKVANAEERDRALSLRAEIYSAELGSSGLDEYDDEAWQLVALREGREVVATLRLARPEQRPFDLETLIDLEATIPEGRSVADLSRFCVREDYRRVRSGQFVHLGMLKLLYAVAQQNRVSDLVTLALPHLEVMYRAVFFAPLPYGDLVHPTFGPVTLMHFDVAGAERRYGKSTRPFARFLFESDLPNVLG